MNRHFRFFFFFKSVFYMFELKYEIFPQEIPHTRLCIIKISIRKSNNHQNTREYCRNARQTFKCPFTSCVTFIYLYIPWHRSNCLWIPSYFPPCVLLTCRCILKLIHFNTGVSTKCQCLNFFIRISVIKRKNFHCLYKWFLLNKILATVDIKSIY